MNRFVQALIPLILFFTVGCTSTLEKVNQDLASVNNALAGKSSSPSRPVVGLATITQDQISKIQAGLLSKNQNTSVAQAISDATPVISNFIKTNSCITGYNGSALDAYAAPGKTFGSFGYIGAPIPQMKYHNKATCASVLRFHGWEMPAKNALRFEVVYIAEDSGESVKGNHELVKQPSGGWLFTR